MTVPDARRPLCCTAAIAALALASCGGSSPHRTPAQAATTASGSIPASDGATAIFRADVTPILCRHARDIARSARLITKASSDAGGPVNASAPQSAQAEYAGALALYASVLASDYAAFGKVHAPASLNREYQQFLESLDAISLQASRLAQLAHARNFTAIANEQGLQSPTAGQQVFRRAGISSCAAPR